MLRSYYKSRLRQCGSTVTVQCKTEAREGAPAEATPRAISNHPTRFTLVSREEFRRPQ